ncbi:MAG: GNAT family N-acetyltransferase [Pseudohongiellaceae bacterium]
MALLMRRGSSQDEDWLFELFRATMQNYIDKAWGWDELFQREGFVTTLPAKQFQILESEGQAIASYHLSEKSEHLYLDMILVVPQKQRQGYGSRMLEQIKMQSRAQNKPIELSVLKTNPAVTFHAQAGFHLIHEDEHSCRMRWSS